MNDTGKFNIGNTVCLNSGGPQMTIDALDGDKATCLWFVEGQSKSKEFSVASLKAVNSSPPAITIKFVDSDGNERPMERS